MPLTDNEAALRAVLMELRPYLDDLVLIGGWVPYLQLRYGRARQSAPRTSRTTEADILIPERLPTEGRPGLVALLRDAGFEAVGGTNARWRRTLQEGQEIEFFLPHRGPARTIGTIQPVEDQPGLGALSLSDLGLLAQFTEFVRLGGEGDEGDTVVSLPTLGAFIATKALTFSKRGGDARVKKGGKDLLYIRDVAAGSEVAEVLERDFRAIAAESDRFQQRLRRAGQQLSLLANFEEQVTAAAAELAERDGLDLAAARADVIGHLEDAREMMAEAHEGVG